METENKLSYQDMKSQAETWHAAQILTSIMQNCLFPIWLIVLLVITSAPWWAWVAGAFYVLSSWVHFLTWLAANLSRKKYLDAEVKKQEFEAWKAGYEARSL